MPKNIRLTIWEGHDLPRRAGEVRKVMAPTGESAAFRAAYTFRALAKDFSGILVPSIPLRLLIRQQEIRATISAQESLEA